jgi:predicted HTH transcriptional regulator
MILDECASAGLPEPVFEQEQGFRVTFNKAATQAPYKYPSSSPQAPPK